MAKLGVAADQASGRRLAQDLANDRQQPVYLVQDVDARSSPWEVRDVPPSDQPWSEIKPVRP